LSLNKFFEWRDTPGGEFAVIGDPIAHSLSPNMFHEAFRRQNLSFTYNRIRVPETEFDAALDHFSHLGYIGINVTSPLKELAFCWAGSHEPDVSGSDSANCLRLLDSRANNTDIAGIKYLINSSTIQGKKALIIGYGGAARSVICALKDNFELSLWARNAQVAKNLDSMVRFQSELSLEGFDLIIHATSAYRHGGNLEFNAASVDPNATLLDLDYGIGGKTPFLNLFDDSFSKIDGSKMLVKQGALAFKWWTELEISEEAMEAGLCL